MERGYEGIEFKEVDRVRKKRKKKHYLLRFLVFRAVCAGMYIFITSSFFAVTSVRLQILYGGRSDSAFRVEKGRKYLLQFGNQRNGGKPGKGPVLQ